jgi:RND family efflux transporter MFP subunit
MNSNEIEVDVNESYIARVTPGQRVTATLDAYPDRELAAKVRTVIPTADRQKATVKVRITFDKLEDFILPDMGVKVAFLEQEEKKAKGMDPGPRPLAFIPKSAVHSDSASSYVLLVHDGKVERRAISLGADRGTEVAVLAGLAPGDSLVVQGPNSLQDGDKVQVQP